MLTKPHTIAIVEDHTLIAKALTGIIEHFNDYEVLYEVQHGKALIEKFKNPTLVPEIILLDINMPVMDGYETSAWIKTNHPSVKVMVLSMLDDDLSLIRMFKNGIKGYLLKNIQPLELRKALNDLVEKGFYYPGWASSKVIQNQLYESNDADTQKMLERLGTSLTEKENMFLQYCCTELSYKEIADKMNVSYRTVDGYRDHLFNKLDIKTRVGLVLFAIKTGRSKV